MIKCTNIFIINILCLFYQIKDVKKQENKIKIQTKQKNLSLLIFFFTFFLLFFFSFFLAQLTLSSFSFFFLLPSSPFSFFYLLLLLFFSIGQPFTWKIITHFYKTKLPCREEVSQALACLENKLSRWWLQLWSHASRAWSSRWNGWSAGHGIDVGKRRKNEGNWQEGRRPREGKEEKSKRGWRLGQCWGSRPWA